jgi:exopolysaccharide biosynthesis polyprenyl glycosylphosphotransferase
MEFAQFKVIPSYFQILASGLRLETISGVPVLGVSELPLDHFTNRLLKRMVDLVGAAVGLILSVPLIAIFGAMVYRESPGPIFYRQERTGRNGRTFLMIKIRSMRLDAEEKGGAQWAKENDPRRLKIGAFLRKWNIDEVPQFWNVLKGDMSLVGPRPERPELISNFKHQIPHYHARHTCLPGITGWAQANGWRGNTSLEERIRYDIWYVENWSLMLDVKIMVQTFTNRKNAY